MSDIGRHVTSLELSKRLDELGVRRESCFYWVINYKGANICHVDNLRNELSLASGHGQWRAYLASEMGEMLPAWGDEDSYRKLPWAVVDSNGKKWYSENDTKGCVAEADARAKMLIYLIENGHVKAEDL